MKAAGNIGTSRRIMRADWKCLHMRSLCQGRGGISVSAVSLCHLSSSISFESLHFCHQLQFFSPLFASLLLRHLFIFWLTWTVSEFPFEFVSCDHHLGKSPEKIIWKEDAKLGRRLDDPSIHHVGANQIFPLLVFPQLEVSARCSVFFFFNH